jgi:hypothetical protein
MARFLGLPVVGRRSAVIIEHASRPAVATADPRTIRRRSKPSGLDHHPDLMAGWRGEAYPDRRPIDPLPAFLGKGVDDHRNNEARRVLGPFTKLLEEFNIACLGITHLS